MMHYEQNDIRTDRQTSYFINTDIKYRKSQEREMIYRTNRESAGNEQRESKEKEGREIVQREKREIEQRDREER